MGQQIRIVQSLEDEAAMSSLLTAKFDVVSLQRMFRTPAPEVKPLGRNRAAWQVLFGRQFADPLLARVMPVLDSKGLYQVDPILGVLVEWERTTKLAGDRYVPGRYYLDTSNLEATTASKNRDLRAAATHAKAVMSYILKTIKSQYPRRSDDRFPIYAGPDLVNLIEQGRASVYYANEKTPVSFIENA